MLHSSFHYATGPPLLSPSSPLLARAYATNRCAGSTPDCYISRMSAGGSGRTADTRVCTYPGSPSCCKGANASPLDLNGLDFTTSLYCLTFRTHTLTLTAQQHIGIPLLMHSLMQCGGGAGGWGYSSLQYTAVLTGTD